jgi:hypothetical protein
MFLSAGPGSGGLGGLGKGFHFPFFEEAVTAARNPFDGERAKADAHNFFDGMMLAEEGAAKGFELWAPHDHLIPVILAAGTRGFRLTDGFEVHPGFFAEALEVGESEHAFYFEVVGLVELVPVLQELGGQIAIVSKENETSGCVFEIADGIDAFGKTAKKIAESFAAFRIGKGGDNFGRLVEEEIDGARGGIDGAAGGFDFVLGGIGFGAEFRDGFAVDADLAGEDELLGVTAGGDAGPGYDLLKAFEHEEGYQEPVGACRAEARRIAQWDEEEERVQEVRSSRVQELKVES